MRTAARPEVELTAADIWAIAIAGDVTGDLGDGNVFASF